MAPCNDLEQELRKMVMAGSRIVVNKRRSMPTLLNDTKGSEVEDIEERSKG